MGRSLTESRRGATLYSASWPRGRPPERSAQGCGERLPPSDPPWSLGPLRAECCHRLRRRRRPARRRHRRLRHRRLCRHNRRRCRARRRRRRRPRRRCLRRGTTEKGRGREGFPARHPGDVARRAAAAARPHAHPARRRRLPRHRGRADGAHCAHGQRILRSCFVTEALTHTRESSFWVPGLRFSKARDACGCHASYVELTGGPPVRWFVIHILFMRSSVCEARGRPRAVRGRVGTHTHRTPQKMHIAHS